jgi:colicin import membrane protein
MASKRLWIIAFLAAFCLHVTILAGSAYFPELFKTKKRAEIYNVKLIGYEASPKRQAVKPAGAKRPGPTPKEKKPARQQVHKAPEPKVEKKEVKEKGRVPIKEAKKKEERKKRVEKKKSPKKTVNKPESRPKPEVKKAVKKAVSTSPKRKRTKEKKRAERPNKRQQKRAEPSSDELIAKRIKGIEEKIRARQEEELLAKRIAALEAKKKGAAEPRGEGEAPQAAGTSTRYGLLAKASIMTHFVVPPILRDKELKAVVSIFVARDGRIVRSVMRKGSGSEIFDHCVMRAIKETGSLPPLPPELRPGPLEIEITFKSSDQI